jgi:hypothetical protein
MPARKPPARKPQPSASRARLKVLAAGDEPAFLAFAIELLASKQRLDREAALEALVERPLAGARDAMRALYFELDSDGLKRDQGGPQRAAIVRYMLAQPLPSDADIAIIAAECVEIMQGEDVTTGLRVLGMRLLAHVAPDVFPYFAIEQLDETKPWRQPRDDGEPTTTALGLLAATGQLATIYQWLIGPGRTSPNLVRAFEAFTDAPPTIIRRYVEGDVTIALRREDETLLTAFCEAIVQLELSEAYPAIASVMFGKVSEELYAYLALLLAGTNRLGLLSVLDEQLRSGRRPKLIIDALRVRTTPEQQAIIDRWERRGE